MSQTLFGTVFFVGLILGWLVRLVYARHSEQGAIVLDRRSPLEFILVILAFTAMNVLPLVYLLTPRLAFADYPLPPGLGLLGVGVFAIGIWLFWRSHADLGRNWTPIARVREGQTLVTHGVYRHIRHPMYAAHWLAAVGQALLLPNWLAGFAFPSLFLPIYLMRVAREERMMLDHFGDRYRQYMRQTGRLVPRLVRLP